MSKKLGLIKQHCERIACKYQERAMDVPGLDLFQRHLRDLGDSFPQDDDRDQLIAVTTDFAGPYLAHIARGFPLAAEVDPDDLEAALAPFCRDARCVLAQADKVADWSTVQAGAQRDRLTISGLASHVAGGPFAGPLQVAIGDDRWIDLEQKMFASVDCAGVTDVPLRRTLGMGRQFDTALTGPLTTLAAAAALVNEQAFQATTRLMRLIYGQDRRGLFPYFHGTLRDGDQQFWTIVHA